MLSDNLPSSYWEWHLERRDSVYQHGVNLPADIFAFLCVEAAAVDVSRSRLGPINPDRHQSPRDPGRSLSESHPKSHNPFSPSGVTSFSIRSRIYLIYVKIHHDEGDADGES